jgi:heme/copper-type cytochrome/quinol oxidase subunit 4
MGKLSSFLNKLRKTAEIIPGVKGIANFVEKTVKVSTPGKDRYIQRLKTENSELKKSNNGLYGTVADLNKEKDILTDEKTKLTARIDDPLYNSNGDKTDVPRIIDSHEIDTNTSKQDYKDDSGLDKQSKAYKNLYNTYYDGYQKDEQIFEKQLKPQVDYLKKTELTGIDFSFDALQKQNQILTNQIKDNKEKYSIDVQKVNYQSEKITSLKATYVFIFFLFYAILLGLIYILFAVNTTMSRNIKIAIVVLFAFYPFYVNVLQQLLYFLGEYIFAIMNGNVYTPNNY